MADETADYRKPVGVMPQSTGGAPLPLQEHQRAQIQGPAVVKGDFGQDEWARMAKSAEKISAAGLTAAHAGETISGAGVQTLDVAVQQQRIAAHAEADIATTKDLADLANKHRDDPAGFEAAASEYRAQRVANSSPGISRYVDRTVGQAGASTYAGLVARKGSKDEALAKEASEQDIILTENKLATLFAANKGTDADGNYTPEVQELVTKYENQLKAGVGVVHSQEHANNRIIGTQSNLMGLQVGNNAVKVLKDPEGGDKKAFDYIDEHITNNTSLPMSQQRREHIASLARAQVHRAITADKIDAGDASFQATNLIKLYQNNDTPDGWPSQAEHEAVVERLKQTGTNGALTKMRELEIARGVATGTAKRKQGDLTIQRSQMTYDDNNDYITETKVAATKHPVLAAIRAPIKAQLDAQPGAMRMLVARAEQEVGDQSTDGKLYFLEETFNRTVNPDRPYRSSVTAAVRDASYYPEPVYPGRISDAKVKEWEPLILAALEGANTSDLSTGNASRDKRTGRMVGFAGGPWMRSSYNRRGEEERHGREGPDLPWVARTQAAMEGGDPNMIQAAARGGQPPPAGTAPVTMGKGLPGVPAPTPGTAAEPSAKPATPDFSGQATQTMIDVGIQKNMEKHYKSIDNTLFQNLNAGKLSEEDVAGLVKTAQDSQDLGWKIKVLGTVEGYLAGNQTTQIPDAQARYEATEDFMRRMSEKGVPTSYATQAKESYVNNLKRQTEEAGKNPLAYHRSKQGNPPPPLRFDNVEANRISMDARSVIVDSVDMTTGAGKGSPFEPAEASIVANKITQGTAGEAAVALDALTRMTPEQLTATLAGDSNPIKAALVNASHSTDGNKMTQVMAALDTIERKDVATFKQKFGAATDENLDLWRERKDVESPQAISAAMNTVLTPQVEAARKDRLATAQKESEKFTINDVQKSFSGTSLSSLWVVGSNFKPNAPTDYDTMTGEGMQQSILLGQFKDLYERRRARGMEPDAAKEAATVALKKEWGSSRANSMAIMRYPPEHEMFNKVYPPVGGRYDYMSNQVSEFVANAQVAANGGAAVEDSFVGRVLKSRESGFVTPGGLFMPRDIGPVGETGVRYTFQSLITDRTTEIQAGAGEKPTYKVLALDHNGRQVLLPGRVGFDPAQAQAEIEASRRQERAEAMAPVTEGGRRYSRTLNPNQINVGQDGGVQRAEVGGGGGDVLTDTGQAQAGMTGAISNEQDNLVAAAGQIGGDHPVIGLIDRLHKSRAKALEPTDEISAQKKSEVDSPNLDQAHADLQLTPQERDLYQRHLKNLYGPGGVDNEDGSRSTLYAMEVEHKGKHYILPTIYDGKRLTDDEAWDKAKAIGLDKFPAYASEEEATARYNKLHDYMDKDTEFLQTNKDLPERVERQALGFLNSLLGKDKPPGTKVQPPTTMAQFPSDQDVEFAKSYGFGYGTVAEPFINQKTAMIYGDVSAAFGGKKLAVFTARSAAGGKISEILNAVNDSSKNINVDLTRPENRDIRDRIGYTYAKTALAVQANPIADLGFDPKRIMVDTEIGRAGEVNIGGLYGPKQDAIYANLVGPGNMVHESIHRGLKLLRDRAAGVGIWEKHEPRPELAELLAKLPKPEELVIRYMMVKYAGDVENEKRPDEGRLQGNEVGAEQRAQAIKAFDDSFFGKERVKTVEAVMREAQRLIMEKRPGGPR
jgi:hypothetical protein